MEHITVKLSSKKFTIIKYLALLTNTYIVGVAFISANFGLIHKLIAGVLFSGLLVQTIIMTGYVQWRMRTQWNDSHTFYDL